MSDSVPSNLSTAILMLDEHMTILFSNQAAENLLLESSEHMLEKCLNGMVANGSELAAIVSAAIESDQVYTRRQMLLIVPGRQDDVTSDVTVTPILGADQALVEFTPMDRYLRIDRDAALKEHHEVTRQMVRGLAHEIKNPLGGIKGSAQLLSRELPDESLNEYTDIIIKEADRLTSLVDRLLGPNVIPDIQPVNIHVLLERISKLVELEADYDCQVVRDYDPSIPEVQADPELMLQALLNITRNAMQALEATDEPVIHLSTRIDRQFTISGKRHKVVLRIDIADNGPGIDENVAELLFYPMISGRPGGTGLGLSLAQSIITQHQGMIEFSSRPGETIFRIYVPLELQ